MRATIHSPTAGLRASALWSGVINRNPLGDFSFYAFATLFRYDDPQKWPGARGPALWRYCEPKNHRVTSRQNRFAASMGHGPEKNPLSPTQAISVSTGFKAGFRRAFRLCGGKQTYRAQAGSKNRRCARLAASMPQRQGECPDLAAKTGKGACTLKNLSRHRMTDPISKFNPGRGTGKASMLIDLPNPSPLVPVDFIRVIYRIDADEVLRRMDYQFVWVWDVSLGKNGVRSLRFWLPSVLTPQMTARLTLNEVLCRLLPESRQTLRGSEVAQLLLASRDSVAQLARILKAPLVNRTWHFKREALFAWMRERYIGEMPFNSQPSTRN